VVTLTLVSVVSLIENKPVPFRFGLFEFLVIGVEEERREDEEEKEKEEEEEEEEEVVVVFIEGFGLRGDGGGLFVSGEGEDPIDNGVRGEKEADFGSQTFEVEMDEEKDDGEELKQESHSQKILHKYSVKRFA